MILFKHRMLFTFLLLVVAGIVASEATVIQEATIYESGTLGSTGIPWSDLTSGAVPSTNTNRSVFTGVRFQLVQPVITSQIGGHFVAVSIGTFFGAIVELDDESDFPDSFDFTTPDFLGAAVLTFPVPSDEVLGNLTLSLDPGWYALVFGSGLLDATATHGATVRNGTDIGAPSYIGLQPLSGFGWFNRTTTPNRRFVVNGEIVPEASSMILWSIASIFLSLRTRTFRRQC